MDRPSRHEITYSGKGSTECIWKSFNLAGYNLLSTKLTDSVVLSTSKPNVFL